MVACLFCFSSLLIQDDGERKREVSPPILMVILSKTYHSINQFKSLQHYLYQQKSLNHHYRNPYRLQGKMSLNQNDKTSSQNTVNEWEGHKKINNFCFGQNRLHKKGYEDSFFIFYFGGRWVGGRIH